MNELELRVKKLEESMAKLSAFSTIPFDTEKAFKTRLGISDIPVIVSSSKSATSENQAVNEAGASSYNVLKAPDAFAQVTINGVTIYIPYFI